MTEEEQADAARDLGVALAWLAQRLEASPEMAKVAATQAIPSLEVTVRNHRDDLPAGQSLGAALEILGRGDEALHAFDGVLQINPRHELTLRSAGRLLARLQQPESARAALQKTIAVNPWRSDYRLALAQVCTQARDWPGAVAACLGAIRLNPDLIEARSLLVECYLHSNQSEKADAEFQTLIRFYPASREVWQTWYARQKQPTQRGTDFPANDMH